MAKLKLSPVVEARESADTSLDPAKVDVVIKAVQDLIASVALMPGQELPPHSTVFEAANRVERALADVGTGERWNDGLTTPCVFELIFADLDTIDQCEATNRVERTLSVLRAGQSCGDSPTNTNASGLIFAYLATVGEYVNSIMERAGASKVECVWHRPSDEREDSTVFPYASEVRGLEDAIRGLLQGLDAMKRGGPMASLNPLHRDGPIDPPDLVKLESLCNFAEYWLNRSRLEAGEQLRPSTQCDIIEACQWLNNVLLHIEPDPRWMNTPRYKVLYEAIDDIIKILSEMTRRGRREWRVDHFEFIPTLSFGGMLEGGRFPLYLHVGEAKQVEIACVKMRRELARFRIEVTQKGKRTLNLPQVGLAGASQIETRIPEEHRTRPLGMAEAAGYLGFLGTKEARTKRLRSLMTTGKYKFDKLSRQSIVFDIRDFPDTKHTKVRPD